MHKDYYTVDEAVILTGYSKSHIYKIVKENITAVSFRNNKIPKKAIEHIVKLKKFIDTECCDVVSILEKFQISTTRTLKNIFPTIEIYNFKTRNYIRKYDAENILEYNEFYKTEFYTKNEIIQDLKISYSTILKNRYILKCHYFKGKTYIARKHVQLFLDKCKFYFNECYSSDVAAKLLGYATTSGFNRAYPNIPRYFYFKKWYIAKKEINSLLQLNNTENYYSLNEIADMLNYSIINTRNVLKGILFIKRKNMRYYLKSDINSFIYEIKQKKDNISKKCYSQEEVLRTLKISEGTLRLGKYKYLHNKKIKYNHINYYYKRDVYEFIAQIKNDLSNKIEENSDTDIFKQDVASILDGYIKLTDVVDSTGLSRYLILRLVHKNQVDSVFYNEHRYISEESINYIKQYYSREYFTRHQLAEKMKISIYTLDQLRTNSFFNSYFIEHARGKYFIDDNDIKYIKTTYTYVYYFIRCNTDLDLYQRVNTCFNFLYDNNCAKSLDYYHKWVIEKLNKTGFNKKKKQEYCHDLIYIFFKVNTLLEELNCELYECSNEDIEFIINMAKFTTAQLRYFCQYINYFRNKYKNICKYDRCFNVSRDQVYTKNSNIYSTEEWLSYYILLTDISKHINKAIEEDSYAQRWLYAILHLSIAWRKSDIGKMPNIDILKKELDFNWLKNNKLSLSQCQLIINYINKQSKFIMTGKTGVRTHFIVPLDLVIPTAYAFIVCEIHRRNADRKFLFNQSIFYSVITESNNLNKLFKEDNLINFDNRKANRTLLTYTFEYASNQEGLAEVAYILSAWLRSHKLNSKNLLPHTTHQYIESTNKDGSFEKIAFQLFRRGIFGWQISVILDIVYNSSSWTVEDKTKRIEELYKLYSPIAVDNFSAFLLNKNELHDIGNNNETKKLEIELQVNDKKNGLLEQAIEYKKRDIKLVISELLTLSHKEIVEKLECISKGLAPGKVENSQCLKSGIKPQQRQCPEYLKASCFGCRYQIPTTYELEFIEEDLLKLMDNLEKTSAYEESKIMKLSFIINKLFLILAESKKIFDTIDKNYIQTFINLKLLKIKHINLYNKYILCEGWKDGINKKC